MPHAEIKHSADLGFDAEKLFRTIEDTILRHDPNSGECKCRAYPAARYRHTHCLVSVSLLRKPHRDAAFTAALLADLDAAITAELAQPCFFSLGLSYSDDAYITRSHTPAA
ncbi:hypothetical protein R5H32_19655 [Defluviimonas sp. D31]|uniref:hypothetical protein n=1 Tax=Defluviimonas sp. D31 TaxID=3083253 RepID=UPI00296E88EC|nr:hypothetical protein [Defluviimonas sp. D31]MDW4551566.1 hypothetical protein [Defluviimonas sp. D31]